MPTVAIISAGTGSPSRSNALAISFAVKLREGDAAERVSIVELRSLAPSILRMGLTGEATSDLRGVLERVEEADVLVMVTPLHNGSYSGLFKMFVDLLDKDAIRGKPVLLAATAGSIRHSLALDGTLRSLFACFRALVVPTVVLATPDDWTDDESPGPELSERIARATQEALALTGSLAA